MNRLLKIQKHLKAWAFGGLIISIFSQPSVGFGQKQALIDSLKHIAKYSDNVLQVINAKNELAYQWRYVKIDTAELLAREALESALKHDKYKEQQGDAYMRLGVILKNRGNYEEAIQYYNKAKGIRENLGLMDGVAAVYSTVGTIYRLEGRFREAIVEYEKGLRFIEADEKLRAGLYNLLAITNRSIYRYGEAITYADSSISIRNRLKDSSGMANVLLTQATIYADLKDYDRAKEKLEVAKYLYESQNDETGLVNYWINRGKIAFYDENELQTIKNAKQMQLIYLLSGIFLLTVFAGGISIALIRQRHKNQMAKAEIELAKTKIDYLLQEQEIKIISAHVEGQEEERKRIAQDLHDRLGSMLAMVKWYFNALNAKSDVVNPKYQEQYQKANTLLDEACMELRQIAQDMSSGILKRFGLAAQVEDLARTIEASNRMKVTVTKHKMDARLENVVEVKLYRIIQELVSNVLKHAQAQHLHIQINRFEDLINIIVEDDGLGFDPKQVAMKNHMGLNNVRSRVEDLNGKLQIDSNPGKSTIVLIDIPLRA